MVHINKYLFLFGIYICVTTNVFSQDMASPYSAYGLGDMDLYNYSLNAGSGYTGIGLKTNLFSTGNNPASAAGMEKNFLVSDFNSVAKYGGYKGNAINASNSSSKDFTIKSASMAIKINSFWASGVGFRQFSSVNYQFSKVQNVEGGSDSYATVYEGDGGLNEYYWNNAFNVGKHLSLGVTSSFISGPINQTESFADAAGNIVESTKRDYYGNWHFELGGIYSRAINKKWSASVGFKYAPKINSNFERTLTVSNNGVVILNEKYLKYSLFKLPVFCGTGISLSNKKGTTISADYYTQKWSALNYKSSGYKLVDANRFSAGVELNSIVNKGLNKIQSRLLLFGAYASNSYLEVNNHVINDYGITAGFKRSIGTKFLIGGSLEYGVRGTTLDGLIRESYIKATVSFSFRDFIFSKGYKFQ